MIDGPGKPPSGSLLDLLRRVIGRDAPAPPPPAIGASSSSEFKKLLRSPLMDTLYAVAGQPRVITNELDPGKVGTFAHRADSLNLTDDAFTLPPWNKVKPVGLPAPAQVDTAHNVPEQIMAHEMGHRYFDLGKSVDAKQDMHAVRYEEGRKPTGYGNASYAEHLAEAFSSAMQFLRYTAGQKPGPDFAKEHSALLREYDGAVPGTARVVQRLLAEPIYAEHPLNTTQGLHNERPDATRASPRMIPAVGALDLTRFGLH